jgi:sulfur carrier protein ThiS
MCVTAIGCNVVRITLNTPLTQNDVAFIVPGQTTLADVIAKLGTPDSITESNMGVVATYRFLDMKYSRINFGWLLKPFSPVDTDMIISRTGFGTDAFELLCDSNWVVTHQSFLRRLSGARFNPYPF